VRGEDFKDLILKKEQYNAKTFNDQTDFLFEGVPGHLYESLEEFNTEGFEGKMTIEYIPNKNIKITIPSNDEEIPNTVVKVKFYESENEGQLIAHFYKK